MSRDFVGGERGVAPVIAVTLLVAIVVVLATTVTVFVLVQDSDVPPPAPQVSVSHELVPDGSERTVAVTLEGGDAVDIDRLYVTGSKPLDIGGAPGSGTPANETDASERETFAETAGGDPQIGIGDQWESGETVYLDPEGAAGNVTISIYWNTQPVEGANPGTVTGDDSYRVVRVRV